VEKSTGAAATVYVYDAAGNEVAQYSTQAQVVGGTEYVTADHLGSTRLVTNAGGTPVACHDYLPFGEELLAPESGRTGCYASVDGVAQKFTGKERDTETAGSATPSGLDYFGARYYSGAQGRFTSPDWSSIPQPVPYADLSNPQSLNLYAYVGNNPLGRIDPDGHQIDCSGSNAGKVGCQTIAQWNEEHGLAPNYVSPKFLAQMAQNGVLKVNIYRSANLSSTGQRAVNRQLDALRSGMKALGITVDVASDVTIDGARIAGLAIPNTPANVLSMFAATSADVQKMPANTPDTSFSGFMTQQSGTVAPFAFINEYLHSGNREVMLHEVMHGYRGDWWARGASMDREIRLRWPSLYRFMYDNGHYGGLPPVF